MKKAILFMIGIIFATNFAMAQEISGVDNAAVFRVYMQRNMTENPETIVKWFKLRPYSTNLGIPKYEYDFYHGIANYYDYIYMHAGATTLVNAKQNFKSVLDSRIANDVNNYKIQAYMFLGAIFLLDSQEREISGHIFKYVYDSIGPENMYYYSSIYWILHTRYIDKITYNSLYQILYRADDRALVYDFETIKPRTKKSMIGKLPKPEKYSPRYYVWSVGSSVPALIANNIFALSVIKEEDKAAREQMHELDRLLNIERTNVQEQPQQPQKLDEGKTTKEPSRVQQQTNLKPEREKKSPPRTTTVVTPPPPPPPVRSSDTASLNFNIVRDSLIDDNVTIKIDDRTLSFDNAPTATMVLDRGTYTIEIRVGRKVFNSIIHVAGNKNNIYTIAIGEKSKNNILYDVSMASVFSENESLTSRSPQTSTSVFQNNNVRTPDRTMYTSQWFISNPYSKSLGMDVERYNYLRGVAYYNDYITGLNNSDSALNRARDDFQSVISANGVDFINASMYLAFINLIQNGDSSMADSIIKRAIMVSGENDYLYPSMLYWRSRLDYMSSGEKLAYNQRLNGLKLNTPIFDYTTGTTITLSDALAMQNQPIGASLIANRNQIGSTVIRQSDNSSLDILNYATANIDSSLNILGMTRNAKVLLAKTIGEIKTPYAGKIFQGSNIVEASDGRTTIAVMLDAYSENNYIFTFIAL